MSQRFNVRTILLCSTYTLCPSVLGEEIMGIHLGALYWDTTIQGRLQSQDIVDADQTTPATRLSVFNLGLSESQTNAYFFKAHHHIPLIPRFMISQLDIASQAQFTTSSAVSFVDTSFETDTTLATSLDLSFTDYSLYYTAASGSLEFDAGLTQRHFDGMLSLAATASNDDTTTDDGGGADTDAGADTGGTDDATGDTGTTDTGGSQSVATIDEKSTMLFGQASFKLPETNLFFNYKTHYKNTGETHISDVETSVSYKAKASPFNYEISVGYKKIKAVTPELGELISNIKLGGPFIGVSIVL